MAESIRPPSLSSSFRGLLITNLVFTDVKLGRGADATVYAVEWNGTVCAAKRLHEILLEDESPGGADKFIRNFEAECLTWSKLRHPGVVQFLGVYLDRSSRLPVLVMEKMDTTLAFMAPEALHNPPRYNEKLDVFSFGNVFLSTLTHEWPNSGPPTRYEGDVFVGITELQRCEQYVEMLTAQEKQLFLPIVCPCLENRPDKRPSSVMLVQELRH